MSPATPAQSGFIAFPQIDAYGDGGFRVEGVRHEGSILIVNGEVMSWDVTDASALTLDDLAPALGADPAPEFILLGSGPKMVRPPASVSETLRDKALGLEFMDTGAACRVYATLVDQGRRLAAALIAV